MPGISEKGYRIYFVEADLAERLHVHVEKSGKMAKYWIDQIELFDPGRFKGHELTEIEKILKRNQKILLDLWLKEMGKRR